MINKYNEELIAVKKLLEKILAVTKLANYEKIVNSKAELLKNPTKRQVYELCDGKHTAGDIVAELGTTQQNISYHLISLLDSGLVTYENLDKNRYYSRTLE